MRTYICFREETRITVTWQERHKAGKLVRHLDTCPDGKPCDDFKGREAVQLYALAYSLLMDIGVDPASATLASHDMGTHFLSKVKWPLTVTNHGLVMWMSGWSCAVNTATCPPEDTPPDPFMSEGGF